ncbi:Vacuoleless1 (VCL1) isoform 1 [Hibiscus syriacus]|uniref:Vacuoleless1 (VCL1) isoform 1 n=1 Tax=Hibiscus syriacus TaxID=106335 RepID=A0A6A3CW97_HIBSY|nr:Vacuoleless1 (VCL1) isoform 1 [Hibiscus syriacus]
MPCRCGSRSTLRDDLTDNLVCANCYSVLDFDNYDAQIGGINGPTGTNIHIGYAGTGSLYSYKDKKLFVAKDLIHEYTTSLKISNSESEVTSMIDEITDGEFGDGDWFHILIGACSYVVMRRDKKFLPAAEVAEVVGCDVYELGRMIARVVKFMKLSLPEVSIAGGPLPVVAAVMAFVAELNGVDGFKIEDVAKNVRAMVSTTKSRYKELLAALVKVAQVLPWGKDITVKNVVKYAPFVIRYMELKSMEVPGEGGEVVENFDIDDVVHECLQKVAAYGDDENLFNGNWRYFEGGNRSGLTEKTWKESQERKSRGVKLHAYKDWWSGKSELSKKLLLEQILEKEVGLDMMPPSYIAGCKAIERRRQKINAAKVRINKIMNPSCTVSDGCDNFNSSEVGCAGKKRKRRPGSEIDWEDFVIEALLLHRVKEEDIEKGHYRALLGLHVFNSGMR